MKVDFFIREYFVLFETSKGPVYFTTTHLVTLIIMFILIAAAVVIRMRLNKRTKAPKGIQNIVEYYVEWVTKLTKDTMGAQLGQKYINYIATLMIYLFFANAIGLIGLRPPTADFGSTLGLALITFVLIWYRSIKCRGWTFWKEITEPIFLLTPINLIGELTTPISLALRLFGNVLSGTVMLTLWYGLMPIWAKIGIPAFLHGYFDLFAGAIQTYVFVMLTMVFIASKNEVVE